MSASGRRLGTAALPQVGSRRRRRAKQGHRGRLASAPGARPRQVTWARASASPWPLRGSHRQQGSLSACTAWGVAPGEGRSWRWRPRRLGGWPGLQFDPGLSGAGRGGGEVAMSTPYRAAQVSARYRRGQSSSLAAAPFCPSR